MNTYSVKFFTLALGLFFCGIMHGMENPQLSKHQEKLPMVERKAAKNALSKLVFADNEKILHAGSFSVGRFCARTMRKKVPHSQTFSMKAHTIGEMKRCEEEYDKVLTFACWDVVKNPQPIFNNSARSLKHNGLFCAVLPYDKSPFINIYHQTFMSDKWKNFYDTDKEVDLLDESVMIKMLSEAGIKVVTCDIVKKPFIFKTKKEFTEWVASYSDELNGIISQDCHVEFTENVVNNYLEEYPLMKDNSVKLYLPYMIISGYKL